MPLLVLLASIVVADASDPASALSSSGPAFLLRLSPHAAAWLEADFVIQLPNPRFRITPQVSLSAFTLENVGAPVGTGGLMGSYGLKNRLVLGIEAGFAGYETTIVGSIGPRSPRIFRLKRRMRGLSVLAGFERIRPIGFMWRGLLGFERVLTARQTVLRRNRLTISFALGWKI